MLAVWPPEPLSTIARLGLIARLGSIVLIVSKLSHYGKKMFEYIITNKIN